MFPDVKQKSYSVVKTGTKGGKEAVAGTVAGVIAMWLATKIWGVEIAPEQLALYTGILVGPVNGILMMLRNVIRELTRRYGFDIFGIFIGICLLIPMIGGCAINRFVETIIDEDGSSNTVKHISYVFAPPGSKAAGEQMLLYKKEGDDWSLQNGQAGTMEGGDLHKVLASAAAQALSGGLVGSSKPPSSGINIDEIVGILVDFGVLKRIE